MGDDDASSPPVSPESRRDRLGLLTAYYNTVRGEILQRQMIRESTLTLFLGASATLAGVAFTGQGDRRWLLFFVPVLGLGASCVYLQHTTATRALWRYLADEFQREVERALAPDPPPVHWDVSSARHGLAVAATMRAAASGMLIFVPGLIAAIAGLFTVEKGLGATLAFITSIVAAILSGSLVAYGFARRPSWYAPPRNDPSSGDVR